MFTLKLIYILTYRVRHQNLDKSNNIFKQNVFNEKLNITKNFFFMALGGFL